MHDDAHMHGNGLNIDEMDFPELDALREQIGLTQFAICARSEINPGTYTRWRRWLRGEAGGSRPHKRSLRAVRDVLRSELNRRAAQPAAE